MSNDEVKYTLSKLNISFLGNLLRIKNTGMSFSIAVMLCLDNSIEPFQVHVLRQQKGHEASKCVSGAMTFFTPHWNKLTQPSQILLHT